MNKFDLMNVALVSALGAEDKALLIELILRSDENWESFPSVERLCKVRGIKHEKNFKGADYYLPNLVRVVKMGRKNHYFLNVDAILALDSQEVIIKHTPALEGVNTPAVADNTPAVEGANSSINNTLYSSVQQPASQAGEAKEDETPLLLGISIEEPPLPPDTATRSGTDHIDMGSLWKELNVESEEQKIYRKMKQMGYVA